MGTNFYIRGHRHTDDPEFHIGKRSAAGLYCWDCRASMFRGPISKLHGSGGEGFHETCPDCGATLVEEDLKSSTTGRELGFNNTRPGKKTGLASCSSFKWAMTRDDLELRLQELTIKPPACPYCDRPLECPEYVIEDEYGRIYTREEFMQVLEECPIEFTNRIGRYFS